MNLQQLKYVISIEKTGSINAAAQLLYLTPSTISLALKSLENELNITIFSRSKQGMLPTKEGTEFIRSIDSILSQINEIENTYMHNEQKKVVLSVSSQHYDFASKAFAKLINYYENEPDMNFRFLETDTKQVIYDVKNNFSEIGLIYLSQHNQKIIFRVLEREELTFNRLFAFQPHVFIRKLHPLHRKKAVTYEELTDFPAITFEQASGSPIQFSEEPKNKIQANKRIYVSDRASAINVLTDTNAYLVGSGIMRSKLTERELISRTIIPATKDSIGWIQKKDLVLSRWVGIYLDLIKETISERIDGYSIR